MALSVFFRRQSRCATAVRKVCPRRANPATRISTNQIFLNQQNKTMRKIFLFTAAMLAIAGCSEDNTHPKVSPVDEPSADAVTILATIDAIPSATGDGEAYAPLWQEGDQIVVGYKGISYVYETYDAGNGVEFHPMALSLPADARGEVTAYFKAVDGVFAVGADQTALPCRCMPMRPMPHPPRAASACTSSRWLRCCRSRSARRLRRPFRKSRSNRSTPTVWRGTWPYRRPWSIPGRVR